VFSLLSREHSAGTCCSNYFGLTRLDLAGTWLGAWGVSWSIAYPTLPLILPPARKLVAAIVEPAKASK
jgi:hypothetical protein